MTLLREPFLHFLLAGTLIYSMGAAFSKNTERYRINIGKKEEARLEETFVRQYGVAPTESQRKDLIDKFLQEEISYREGHDLGLDQEDEIIRRRVAQKFEFLQQDRNAAREPTSQELREWFEKHRDKYVEPARVTFTHIFFSPDREGLDAAKSRALHALSILAKRKGQEQHSEFGDGFPDQFEYAGLSQNEVARVFGQTPISEAVFSAKPGEWFGPVQSGFGMHLVRLHSKQLPLPKLFPEVEDKVRADWLIDFRKQENGQTFAKIRSRYQVVRL